MKIVTKHAKAKTNINHRVLSTPENLEIKYDQTRKINANNLGFLEQSQSSDLRTAIAYNFSISSRILCRKQIEKVLICHYTQCFIRFTSFSMTPSFTFSNFRSQIRCLNTIQKFFKKTVQIQKFDKSELITLAVCYLIKNET